MNVISLNLNNNNNSRRRKVCSKLVNSKLKHILKNRKFILSSLVNNELA